MLPGFIRTMIDNGQIESGVPVFSVRPDRRKQQKRERDMTRMLMNGNRSLTVSNEVSLIHVTNSANVTSISSCRMSLVYQNPLSEEERLKKMLNRISYPLA